MELLYTVSRKQPPSIKNQNVDWLHECVTLCSVSNQNIVAFTTSTDVEDTSGKSWASHVYVADLNSPWECHRVLTNDAEITVLEWDLSGSKLLVTDVGGKVQVWSMKDHLLNEWTCLQSTGFSGEHIICAAFFHNGKKMSLVPDKKDSPLYSDKFASLRFAPSVRHFAGRPLEGCVLVGTSGMVGVVVFTPDGRVMTASESLGSVRHRIRVIDMCYAKNGDFLVASSSGKISLPIQCYRVVVRMHDDKCTVTTQALPSFFLQCSSKDDNTYTYISGLKFAFREDADALIVAASGKVGSMVELWELREKVLSINKLFLQNQNSETYKSVVWQHSTHFPTNSPVVRIATPLCSVTSATPSSCPLVVALVDGSIMCLYRDSLQQPITVNVNSTYQRGEELPLKMARRSITVASMQFSWTNSLVFVMDSQSQMYLYRLTHTLDPVTLLEYCLVTGMNWWDVLMCLRGHMLEMISERFSESFNRQLASLQQCYYVRFMAMKVVLYRMQQGGQQKASFQNALLMLHLIASAFKALLRPSDLSSHDKGPGESLSEILSAKSVECVGDVDKALLNLEAKEYTVEASTLQSLQQLIQWVANFALSLLAALPEHRQNKGPGYEILKDAKTLSLLRELVVIMRIWGLIRSTCLPTFVRSTENLDVLGHLFRLLTRLLQTQEPDDALLDECCLLYSQVMIPHVNFGAMAYGIASPALWLQTTPLQLEYGQEPDFVQFKSEPSPFDGAAQREALMDAVRHIYLGQQPAAVKQCTRCCSLTLLHGLPRSAANRAWDQRWARGCPCGGHWKLRSVP